MRFKDRLKKADRQIDEESREIVLTYYNPLFSVLLGSSRQYLIQ